MSTEPAPKERRSQKTRQTILKAAQDLVVEKGVDNVSIREIAKRVDYSPAALYEYFDDKSAILASLCQDGFAKLGAHLNRVPRDLEPEDRVVQLGLAYLGFSKDNPELYALVVNHLPSGITEVGQLEGKSSPFNTIESTLRAGVEAGVFKVRPGFDTYAMAYSYWAFVHGIAMMGLTQMSQFRDDLSTVHATALRIFVEAM